MPSDATDKFSAVFGNNESALVINTPDGIYNDAFNSSWNASGINAALFGFFPDLEFDSYATIGLDGPAASVAGAEDPSLVQDVIAGHHGQWIFSNWRGWTDRKHPHWRIMVCAEYSGQRTAHRWTLVDCANHHNNSVPFRAPSTIRCSRLEMGPTSFRNLSTLMARVTSRNS